MSDPSDAELVARVIEGDEPSFRVLYRRHTPAIYAWPCGCSRAAATRPTTPSGCAPCVVCPHPLGLEIGLNEVEKPRGTGGAVLNIGVADVIAARKTLEARGVTFNGETVIVPGKVALAGFADPDGNVLRFAGPPPKRP